jgi:tricorn protease
MKKKIIICICLVVLVISFSAESSINNNIVFLRNLTGVWNIWTYNPESQKLKQVTFSDQDDGNPVWITNKTGIAFLRGGNIYRCQNGKERQLTTRGIYRYLSDDPKNNRLLFSAYSKPEECDIGYYDLKTGQQGILLVRARQQVQPKVSGDGNFIYFAEGFLDKVIVVEEIYRLDLQTNQIEPLLKAEGKAFFRPTPNRDNEYLAFISNQTGNTELYLLNVNNQVIEPLAVLDSSYHDYPCWSPDGRKLLYTALIDNKLQLVCYDMAKRKNILLDINGECRDSDW